MSRRGRGGKDIIASFQVVFTLTLGPLLLRFKTRFLVWRQAFKPAMSRPCQAPPLPVPGLFCRLCSAALALRGGGQAAARRARSGRPGPLWKPVHGPGAAARSPTAAPGGWAARPSGSEEPCMNDCVRLRKSSSTGQSSVTLAGKARVTVLETVLLGRRLEAGSGVGGPAGSAQAAITKYLRLGL